MCISLLKRPQFTGEFILCDHAGGHVAPGLHIITETDLAARIGRLGMCAALAWTRLHCTPLIVDAALSLRVDRAEPLDITEILRLEQETLRLQRAQHLFEHALQRQRPARVARARPAHLVAQHPMENHPAPPREQEAADVEHVDELLPEPLLGDDEGARSSDSRSSVSDELSALLSCSGKQARQS